MASKNCAGLELIAQLHSWVVFSLKEPLKNYLTRPSVVEFGKKCSCKLGNCSCIALPPASLQSSAFFAKFA